jgi:hypothetical protein
MKISGQLDLCGPTLIEGWIYWEAFRDEPVRMQVFVGDKLIGEAIVDQFRADLRDAGYGDGHCGFSFRVPDHLQKLRFAATRMRLGDSSIYLLPNEYTSIAPAETDSGGSGKSEESDPYKSDHGVSETGHSGMETSGRRGLSLRQLGIRT